MLLSTQLLTVLAYQPFLFQNVTISHYIVAVAYLVFLGVLARVIYKRIWRIRRNRPGKPGRRLKRRLFPGFWGDFLKQGGCRRELARTSLHRGMDLL